MNAVRWSLGFVALACVALSGCGLLATEADHEALVAKVKEQDKGQDERMKQLASDLAATRDRLDNALRANADTGSDLMSEKARMNQLAGRTDEIAHSVEELQANLAAARTEHWIGRLGLDAYAELQPTTLPLGLQRVAELARAMAAEPQLLLLDEPAAGLNAVEKQHLSELLVALNAETGAAVLLIDHDMTLVMGLVHRVAVLDFGRKIADDTPGRVAADPAVIAAYLGV